MEKFTKIICAQILSVYNKIKLVKKINKKYCYVILRIFLWFNFEWKRDVDDIAVKKTWALLEKISLLGKTYASIVKGGVYDGN